MDDRAPSKLAWLFFAVYGFTVGAVIGYGLHLFVHAVHTAIKVSH